MNVNIFQNSELYPQQPETKEAKTGKLFPVNIVTKILPALNGKGEQEEYFFVAAEGFSDDTSESVQHVSVKSPWVDHIKNLMCAASMGKYSVVKVGKKLVAGLHYKTDVELENNGVIGMVLREYGQPCHDILVPHNGKLVVTCRNFQNTQGEQGWYVLYYEPNGKGYYFGFNRSLPNGSEDVNHFHAALETMLQGKTLKLHVNALTSKGGSVWDAWDIWNKDLKALAPEELESKYSGLLNKKREEKKMARFLATCGESVNAKDVESYLLDELPIGAYSINVGRVVKISATIMGEAWHDRKARATLAAGLKTNANSVLVRTR